jgi:hypothetical protein
MEINGIVYRNQMLFYMIIFISVHSKLLVHFSHYHAAG